MDTPVKNGRFLDVFPDKNIVCENRTGGGGPVRKIVCNEIRLRGGKTTQRPKTNLLSGERATEDK